MRIWFDKEKWKRFGDRCARIVHRVIFPVFLAFLSLTILFASMALIISAAVCNKVRDRILDKDTLLEMGVDFDCILVLGCRVYSDGTLSHMLSDRVETASSLYAAGICDHLLMSGDHREDSYNEVDPMKLAAEAHGVPSDAIATDPMGLSTYDSIMRFARENRGARVIIVTQSYHLYRALYLAEKAGLDAYGVSADLRTYRGQIKYDVREIAARCKDVYFAEKKPAPAGLES
ncbi:MAG: YdcF family protein [Clostridia bacterium]|nr:YdcF family protein [Clostridia bacterium]